MTEKALICRTFSGTLAAMMACSQCLFVIQTNRSEMPHELNDSPDALNPELFQKDMIYSRISVMLP